MELVTVLNRSSKDLTAIWDGKPHLLPARKKVALPIVVAEAARRQHPVMGSEDPYSGDMEYLVAIIEQGDPETPIEQTKAITRMNRSGAIGKNDQVIEGRTGLYSARDVNTSLPASTNFVKP